MCILYLLLVSSYKPFFQPTFLTFTKQKTERKKTTHKNRTTAAVLLLFVSHSFRFITAEKSTIIINIVIITKLLSATHFEKYTVGEKKKPKKLQL